MTLGGAYAYFCDDNNLPRIEASKSQRKYNLLLLIELAQREIDKIENPEVPVSHWGLH